ncbi:MAG: PKD domain-containing protein [bacterium]
MRVKTLLESGLLERGGLRSGRIYKEGSSPKYGVIFTINEARSEDDLGLDPKLILGALMGKKGDPESDRNLFFEILGGYFYRDNFPDAPKTTHVFGIAREAEFGIEEGGSTTLKGNWKLDDPEADLDPRKANLDEAGWSEKWGKQPGWTFIVELKETERFPVSKDPLKIFVLCPEIKDMGVTVGECKTEGKKRLRQVVFAISVDGEPVSWTCDFGDGARETGEGKPPAKIEHWYDGMPGSAPKFSIAGPGACDEQSTTMNLSEAGFEPCSPCPEITRFEHVIADKDENTKSVTFTLTTSGGTPEKFEWDWGDGSPKETTTQPTVTHDYQKPASGTTNYTVTVKTIGPEDCRDSDQKIVPISVNGTAPPPSWCFLLALLPAFFLSILFGALVVEVAIKIFNLIQTPSAWLVEVILILAVLAVAAVIVWYILTRKTACPAPSRCDWFGLGWVVALTGSIVAYYVRNCCANWWWLVIVLLLVLAVILVVTWVRKWDIKARSIVFHLLVSLIAAVIVCQFIAFKILAYCLSGQVG